MDPEKAIAFLQSHQPMPSDRVISSDEADTFIAILRLFAENPDSRCIPLFIRAISKDTTLGMYESIEDVLLLQPREAVVSELRDALQHGTLGQKYRCCWWAAGLGAWELFEFVAPLANSHDKDVAEAAQSFVMLARNRELER